MLSRLALRNAQVIPAAIRGVQTTTASSSTPSPPASSLPRPQRLIEVSPVRHGFIPEEWFTFFYPKTGASGPYVFAATLATFLLSKEYYVIEHESYNAISLFIIFVYGIKKFGPPLSNYLEKERDAFEQEFVDEREEVKKCYQDSIDEMQKEKWRLDAQNMIMEAKKANVLMQLEGVYRERLHQVYTQVKKRLDYHVQIDAVERRIAQKHMVQWIISNVMKAITPEQEKANLQQCIKDLEALAAKA